MIFRDCRPEDAEAVSELAGAIWRQVYPELISSDQIEYMLRWMYDPEKIREDIGRGIIYFFIVSPSPEGEIAGYAAFGPDPDEAGIWLHKLYVDPAYHRRGFASRAINEILRRIENTDEDLRLRVNRGNEAAIATHQKNGFEVIEERCSDIGGGFVMDDFIMRKSIQEGAKLR